MCHFDRVTRPMHLGPGHILEGKIEIQLATTEIEDWMLGIKSLCKEHTQYGCCHCD